MAQLEQDGWPAQGSPGVFPPGREAAPREAALDPPEGDRARSPRTSWPWWSALLALAGGLVLAAIGQLVVDIPALALGANVTASHTPAGLAIAGTVVQEACFVLAAVWCAHLGGRAVRAWQLGLRAPGVGWRRACALVAALFLVFLAFSAGWTEAFNPGKEKLLEQLGSNEGALLLVASAALTCVLAPICEELLFRAYIFTALRNRIGTASAALATGILFGAVHAGSAPALDLVPLAALGVGLCLLYRYTGSIYPCMLAHAINNSVAFASLEEWGVPEGLLLLVAAVACVMLLSRGAARIGFGATGTLMGRRGA